MSGIRSSRSDAEELEDSEEDGPISSVKFKAFKKSAIEAGREVRKLKRALSKATVKSAALQLRCTHIEAALSLVHRLWDKLQHDLEGLLSSFTSKQPHKPVPQRISSNDTYLSVFLEAESEHMSFDPTKPLVSVVRVDEWSTDAQFEEERARILSLKDQPIELDRLDAGLQQRALSTQSLLKSLISEIQRAASAGCDFGSLMQSHAQARASKAEALLYRHACIKLRSELGDAVLDLTLSEIRNRRLERTLSRTGLTPIKTEAEAKEDEQPLKRRKSADEDERTQTSSVNGIEGISSQQLFEVRQQVWSLREALSDLQHRYTIEISKVEQQKIDLQHEYNLRIELERRVKELSDENASLHANIQTMHNEIDAFRVKMEHLSKQTADAAAERLRLAQLENSALQSKALEADTLANKVTGLEAQLCDWGELNSQLEKNLSQTQSQLRAAQNKIKQLDAQLEESRTRERNLSTQASPTAELEKLRALCEETQAELTESQVTVEGFLAELDGVFQEKCKFNEEKKRLLEQISEYEKHKISTHAKLKAKDAKIHKLVKDGETMTKRIKSLTGLLDREQSQRDAFKMYENTVSQQLILMQEERSRMVQEFFVTRQSHTTIAADLERKNAMIESLTKQCEEFTKRHDALASSLSLTQQELEIQRMVPKSAIMATNGGSTSPLDDTESALLERLRATVKCGVCSTNLKDRIIVRCGHMFCNQCVQKEIKSRNRRCPQCNQHFDPADSKPAYL